MKGDSSGSSCPHNKIVYGGRAAIVYAPASGHDTTNYVRQASTRVVDVMCLQTHERERQVLRGYAWIRCRATPSKQGYASLDAGLYTPRVWDTATSPPAIPVSTHATKCARAKAASEGNKQKEEKEPMLYKSSGRAERNWASVGHGIDTYFTPRPAVPAVLLPPSCPGDPVDYTDVVFGGSQARLLTWLIGV